MSFGKKKGPETLSKVETKGRVTDRGGGQTRVRFGTEVIIVSPGLLLFDFRKGKVDFGPHYDRPSPRFEPVRSTSVRFRYWVFARGVPRPTGLESE